MTTFSRADRVGVLIQEVLSDILHRHVSDPRLEMATITAVKMSRDLKHARIYFIAPGGKTKSEIVAKGFISALGYIKRSLASRLELRYMPELKFFYDDSFDYGSHIDQLLESVKTDDGTNHSTD